MENGYVKIYRTILNNPIIKKPVYAWLWTVLLLKANHKETKMIWNGEIIIIKEGQFITGRKQLSEETKIPESTIEDILKYLERQHQIQQQKTTKFRLITIVNWKKYQNSDSVSNNKATTKQQQADTNKNDKNDKNDKNNPIAETAKWDFKKYLEGMEESKRRDLPIIALYWKFKKFAFTNKKQAEVEIKRSLRAAKELEPFEDEKIWKTMDWLSKNADYAWKLETVGKFINEDVNKIRPLKK